MNEWINGWGLDLIKSISLKCNDVKNRIRDWDWEKEIRKLLYLVYLQFFSHKMAIICEYKLFSLCIFYYVYTISFIYKCAYPLVHFAHIP